MQIGLSSLPDRAPDPTATDPGAQTSGPGFDRLIAAAQAEADRRRAIAAQSGASADQFTEQSWLQTFKAHGAEIGLGPAAQSITKDPHGQWTILDPVLRAKVLNYRTDTVVRALMAVKRASDGKAMLSAELGRQPTDSEMRVAETLGGKVAAKLILARQATPNASAALTAPDAAKANRSLFYRPDGSPQTLDEVLVAAARPPAPSQAETAAKMLSGHPAGSGAAAPLVKPALTPSQVQDTASNLRAQATFANTAKLHLQQQPQHRQPPPPPNAALIAGTIGNLSMPGSASGTSAPTGGKISGWRAQMAGEVTHQVEHPETTVSNAPSNVTIPAPSPVHPSYAVTAPGVAQPGATQAAAQSAATPASQLLGPELVPTTAPPQPIPPVAFAPPAAPAIGSQALIAPVVARLPDLVAAGASLPPDALPLLPAEVGQGPLQLAPQSGPPQQSDASQATATQPDDVPPPVVVRPSRYGPDAGRAAIALPQTNALGYVASPSSPGPSLANAAVAGIRPSRIFVGAAVAAQAYATNLVQGSVPAPQTPSPAFGQQAYNQSLAAQAVPVEPPVDSMRVLGPDGVPVLPPVPPRSGLAPITATQALQSGPLDQMAVLSGTKPLDLAPSAAVVAPPAQAEPVQLQSRPRPRNIPAFLNRT